MINRKNNNADLLEKEILKVFENVSYVYHDKENKIPPHAILDVKTISAEAMDMLKEIFKCQEIIPKQLIDPVEGKNFFKIEEELETGHSLQNLNRLLNGLSLEVIKMSIEYIRIRELRKYIKNLDWKFESGKEEEREIEKEINERLEKESRGKTEEETKELYNHITNKIFDIYDCEQSKQSASINKIGEETLSAIKNYLLKNSIECFIDKQEIFILGFSNIEKFNRFIGLEETYKSFMENKKERTGEDVIQEAKIEVDLDPNSSIVMINESDLNLLSKFLGGYNIMFVKDKNTIKIFNISPLDLINAIRKKDYGMISASQISKQINIPESSINKVSEQEECQNIPKSKRGLVIEYLSCIEEEYDKIKDKDEYILGKIPLSIHYEKYQIPNGIIISDIEKYMEMYKLEIYFSKEKFIICEFDIDKAINIIQADLKELNKNSNTNSSDIDEINILNSEIKKLKDNEFDMVFNNVTEDKMDNIMGHLLSCGITSYSIPVDENTFSLCINIETHIAQEEFRRYRASLQENDRSL